MTNFAIAVLPGDGIGPEVTECSVRVLRSAADRHGHSIATSEGLIGGAAIDECGEPLPAATVELCQAADAVLLGAVGGPQWDDERAVRPEHGLLGIRKALEVFANLRPVRVHPAGAAHSPLRRSLVDGVDVLFVRELTGGIYFGAKERTADAARDECVYTADEIERVVRIAGRLAMRRRRRLTSVDKANVLETSRLWREVTTRVVNEEFPEVELEHLLVDAMTMHLLHRPRDFDVVVTDNMFGDILTDEASVLAGSLGMLPSASLGAGTRGLYEPVHGSAPDLAGRGLANPYGAILSAALLARHSLGLDPVAASIENAVWRALTDGVLPTDLCEAGEGAATSEVASAVLERLT